ncbi:fungal-specific transcription factor domain-containing protein [Schizophyllum commune]
MPDKVPAVDDQPFASERAGSKRKRLTKVRRQMRWNRYFASKPCTYTDSQGRPVPAPIVTRDQSPSSSQQGPYRSASLGDARASLGEPRAPLSDPRAPLGDPRAPAQPLPTWTAPSIEDPSPRKRLRTSASGTSLGYPVDYLASQSQHASALEPASPVKLDNRLIRELVGLFFTHCHPARLIFHKPTFTAALKHGVVPPYLVFAMCALAAPLSKQPRLRTSPARYAGRPFAQEALSLMFDGAGRLVCEPSLAVAQALCLLQIHDTRVGGATAWNMRYHDLNFQVCDRLGVHSNEDPPRPALSSASAHTEAAINRECLRRVYWLMYLLDILVSVYVRGPRHWLTADPRLRLPCDETAFEMAVGTTPAEYLYLPPPQTENASEIGHLIRVATIWAELEFALEDVESNPPEKSHVRNLEIRLNAWEASLPPHLQFTDEVLAVQQLMLETSSNNDAWCWANMHMYRASCALLLHEARSKGLMASPVAAQASPNAMQTTFDPVESDRRAAQPTDVPGGREGQPAAGPETEDRDAPPNWPAKTLQAIVRMFGDRAKNSSILGNVIWLLIKHCRRDDEEILKGIRELEDLWGAYTEALARDVAANASDRSSENTERSIAPAPTLPSQATNGDGDEDTPRRPARRRGSMDSAMRSVMPPPPMEVGLPSSNMNTVQPSGLPGYIDPLHPTPDEEKQTKESNEYLASLLSQPVGSHERGEPADADKRLEERARTPYSPAFPLPPYPHDAARDRSSSQTFTGLWPEPRQQPPGSQHPLSPLKLPDDWGIAHSGRHAHRSTQASFSRGQPSGPSYDPPTLPGPSYDPPAERTYEREPTAYLQRRMTYPSDAYYSAEPPFPERPMLSRTPTDPRALPSLRSSGLLSGSWDQPGPSRGRDTYGRDDYHFATNAATRSDFQQPPPHFQPPTTFQPPPQHIQPSPTFTAPFAPRSPSPRSSRHDPTLYHHYPLPSHPGDDASWRGPAGWHPDAQAHLSGPGMYPPRTDYNTRASAPDVRETMPLPRRASNAPTGLPWLFEEQPPAG